MTPGPPKFKGMTPETAKAKMKARETRTEAREEWLQRAVSAIRPIFKKAGFDVPQKVRVSVGFPYGAGRKAAGQCFSSEMSADKTFEIFVTPMLAEPAAVLTVAAHELVHTVVGIKAKHGKEFKACANAIGLEGKMTATHAGEDLAAKLAGIAEKLGPYPHAELIPTFEKKQTARLIKVSCPSCDYVCRVCRVHLDGKGAPICPACKVQFIEETLEEE